MRAILLVPVAMALGASAQTDLGGKVGFNYQFQSVTLGDDAPAGTEEPRAADGPGFHVGVFAAHDLSERLYLRPELLYSTRSSSASLSSSTTVLDVTTKVDAETRSNLSYLELPLMLGIRVSEKLSLQAGPAFGFLLGSTTKVTGTSSVTTSGETVTTSLDATDSSTDGLNTMEVAGVVGLGYRMDNGLDLGLRYWRGFTTLEENTDLTKTHQNVVQVSLGYAFLRDRTN
ncbi:MAG: PorT family protein [Flavobacteriales bacterium]|nr:PorT family protein [Flavobacteriales bacterium]